MNKALLLVATAIIVLLATGMYGAEAVPKPFIPEFSLQFIDNSHDIPTSHITDPYSGQNVTQPGYHVEKRTIEIRIKNQPFTPYETQDNGEKWTINFFYNIRVKGHFAQNWSDIYGGSDGFPVQDYGTDYTVIQYPRESPDNGALDFQVKAIIGYEHGVITTPPWSAWIITGEESEWSDTQIVTISEAFPSPTTTQAPTSSPSSSASPIAAPTPFVTQQTQPQQPQTSLLSYVLVAVAAVIIAFVVGVLVTKLRYKKSVL